MNKVLIVDPTKCKGCHSCEIACATWNSRDGENALSSSRIRITSFLKEVFFYPSVCLQCETPYCALVCPAKALTKNTETNVVELDEQRCLGCKLCLVACPFGNVTFSKGASSKCNLCGGDPTCVKVCQWGALTYGEADEIGSGKRVVVASKVFEAQKSTI